MKKTLRFKNFFALLLAMFMLFSMTANAAPAGSEDLTFDTLGSKTAEALVKPGQYEITLSVPGALETEEYSEIIVMVDASTSQGANLPKLKSTLVDIADQVLHNDGSVRLTLMGFGMGPALVGSFYNAETLEAYLANVTQKDLRQGVSATNCEGALDFVREYIEKSDNLNKTCVIFTSDGSANMDEVVFNLLDWDQHPEWFYQSKEFTVEYIAGTYADIQCGLLAQGGSTLAPTATLYPTEATAVEVAKVTSGVGTDAHKAAIEALYNKITANLDSKVAFADAVIADIMKNAGIDSAVGTSTSKYEKAFLDYENGAFTDCFLFSVHGMDKNAGFYLDSHNVYSSTTQGARAAAAADKLCENDKVLELFMVDFLGKANIWMNPDSVRPNGRVVTSDKITYLKNANVSAAIDTIKSLGEEMFKTLYKDVTVTDPMSKWVILDEESIKLCKDDTVIWSKNDGWLVDESERPVSSDSPVTIETNKDGHSQITWKIKDGALLYTDRYFLKYTVDVDSTAEGFEYNTEYPANDPTSVTYEDENGDEITKDIPVPDVQLPKQDDFEEDDLGIRIYKGTSDSKPISDITFSIYQVPADADSISEVPTEEEIAEYAVDNNLAGNITTDANGYAAINLTEKGEGIYLLIEQSSDKVEAPVAPFYVAVPMYDTKDTEETEDDELQYIVSVFPKNTLKPEENPPIPPVIPDDPDGGDKGKITILKHQEGDEERVLEGAEFQLYKLVSKEDASAEAIEKTYNGAVIYLEPTAVTLTTDAEGRATTPELSFGLYFLVETKAPIGYVALNEPIPAWVTATSHSEAYMVKIPNTSIVKLPETGGAGTTLITVIGSLIIVFGVVLLIYRRRNTVK